MWWDVSGGISVLAPGWVLRSETEDIFLLGQVCVTPTDVLPRLAAMNSGMILLEGSEPTFVALARERDVPELYHSLHAPLSCVPLADKVLDRGFVLPKKHNTLRVYICFHDFVFFFETSDWPTSSD